MFFGISGKYIKRLFLSIFYLTEAENPERDFCDSVVPAWPSLLHGSGAEHFYMDICIYGMWFFQETPLRHAELTLSMIS